MGAACDDDYDCDGDLRCDGVLCTNGCISDDECPGPYGCSDIGADNTDADGCVERCAGSEDCKAGAVCDPAGACVIE